MTQKQKLLNRVLNGNTSNLSFDDFLKATQLAGMNLRSISGSHHIMTHPDIDQPFPIQPDKNRNAKAYQIKQFRIIHASLNSK